LVSSGGQRVAAAGQIVSATWHCVATGGQYVTVEAVIGHSVCTGGHLVADAGHCVSTGGQTVVCPAPPHWVVTGGQWVGMVGGQRVGITGQVVS